MLFASTVIFSNELQPRNAAEPIFVTLAGISMLVNELQFSNAYSPILVMLFGIIMLVNEVQLENAERPMLVPPVIITVLRDVGTSPFLSV